MREHEYSRTDSRITRKADGGAKAVTDVVYHYAEAFKCSHAQKRHIAFFGEYNLVNCGVALGVEYGVADVPLDYTFVRRCELFFEFRHYACVQQYLLWHP